MTVHKAQGLTVDTCLLYGTGALCQQAGYVGMSRGRVANHLYTSMSAFDPVGVGVDVEQPARFELMSSGPDPAEVLEALAGRLAERRVHRLASRQRPVMPPLPVIERYPRPLDRAGGRSR